MTVLDPSLTRDVLKFAERIGIPAILLLGLGAVYLGFFSSPVMSALEAHDLSVNETVRIARLQCAFLAKLAKVDGTPCFNVDISRGTPVVPIPRMTQVP